MKVIIAGSRTINNYLLVRRAMRLSEFEVTEIVSGGARGVDTLGEKWAVRHGIPIKLFFADWDLHKKSAGYRRNVEMAEYADALVVIWDGASKGTVHMIDIMREKKKPVYVLRTDQL